MAKAADPANAASIPPEVRSLYTALQQEADFALWKAKEASAEIKQAHTRLQAGEGPGPTADDLAQVAALERDAEAKYRALREFLKGYFG